MRSILLALALLLGCAHSQVQAQVILLPRYGPRVMNPFPYSPPVTYTMPSYNIGSIGVPYATMGLTGPTIYPGFGAQDPIRLRPTVYPAIPLPKKEIIEASLSGAEDNRASLTIVVPESNARVFLDGVMMNQSGIRRQFTTPPLASGSDYVFELLVQWQDERGPQSRTRSVTVTPGGEKTVYVR